MALIAPHVTRAYVSVRADQSTDPLRARFPQIRDAHENLGPIAGLLAAQARHPEAAWLMLACDLPLLDELTLAHLVRSRAPERVATAYRSSHDGLPEPLCAIWEPRTAAELYAELAQRYPFSLAPAVLRVAINTEFREWTAPLANGDAVVFIPPVAGG